MSLLDVYWRALRQRYSLESRAVTSFVPDSERVTKLERRVLVLEALLDETLKAAVGDGREATDYENQMLFMRVRRTLSEKL